jgi:WD40 repeat protein
MGGFYGSVQVRGEDREAVRAALEGLARKEHRSLLGPPLDGWIGVYPSGHGQDFRVARALARRLPGELIAMLVHDDDIFAYKYYRDGRLIDEYDSIPDYFEPVTEEQRRRLRGRPETFAHLARDPAKFAAVRDRLAAQECERAVFASELLEEFAEALGIRNAVTSYEYLQENEETEGIEGWDQFVHVPDLSREKARRRAAEAALEGDKRRLIEQGRLLAERGGLPGWDSPSPWLCPSPDGRGFLVAWSSHAAPNEGSRPLERHGPPWSAGPSPTAWAIGPHVYGLELSPSGRYLAVAHAAGEWKAGLLDLVENRPVAEVPQVRAVSSVGFLPDESAMVSVSSDGVMGRVILTPIGGGNAQVIAVSHVTLAAAHPSGSSLVAIDTLNRLLVVDIASGKIRRTRLVGGRPTLGPMEQQVWGLLRSVTANLDVDEMERRLRQQQSAILERLEKTGPRIPGASSIEQFREAFGQQIEEQIRQMRERVGQAGRPPFEPLPEQGSEKVFRARFDSSGDRLALATMAGVRVYPWRDVMDADGDLPRPALAVDLAGTMVPAGPGAAHAGGYVYDLEFDPDRDRLIFAGLDGRVRFLDLDSGRSGILLEPPGRPPIHRLILSRDRSALAVVSMPDMFSQGRNRRGPIVQFWDYQAISREALSGG